MSFSGSFVPDNISINCSADNFGSFLLVDETAECGGDVAIGEMVVGFTGISVGLPALVVLTRNIDGSPLSALLTTTCRTSASNGFSSRIMFDKTSLLLLLFGEMTAERFLNGIFFGALRRSTFSSRFGDEECLCD